jgi:hypothetical protein
MNCRSFETTITELARGQMLEAQLKEDALAHLKDCQRCAARFADERALTAGLHSVAAKMALAEAPARAEESLLSAFRQRATNSFTSVNAHAPAEMARWRIWSIAAAAGILIGSTFTVSRLLFSSSKPAPRETSIAQEAPRPLSSGTGEEINQSSADSNSTPLVESPGESVTIYSTPRPANRRRGLMPGRGDGRMQTVSNKETASASEEIATDFLPLTYDANLSQLDGGQVVRVELPRAALQTFGLPMNAERAGERVKADVLLGHDGVARAIRFVR